MTTGKALLGVVAGMAAGAAIGLLFAPHSGEKTRKKLVHKGEDLAGAINHNIERKFNDLIASVNSKITRGKVADDSVLMTHEHMN